MKPLEEANIQHSIQRPTLQGKGRMKNEEWRMRFHAKVPCLTPLQVNSYCCQ